MEEFQYKVALITGAGSGIGRETAKMFAKYGAQVVVSDQDETSGQGTVNMIRELGGKSSFIKCNVAVEAEVQELISKTVKEYGRLDCVFNNAGIEGKSQTINECTRESWDKTVSVDLTGVWQCMKYEIEVMLKFGGGKIVNCSSIAGIIGFENLAPYVASKHGIIGLTKTAALEFAKKGIRINAVCPGVIETPMLQRFTQGDVESMAKEVPMGRLGQPNEIAETVIWLCSDKSSYITGQAIIIDGGWTSK